MTVTHGRSGGDNCGASAGDCEVIGNLRQIVRAPAGAELPMRWPPGKLQSRN